MRLRIRQARSYAIYYGFAAVKELEGYDVVVLHPGAHSKADLQQLKDRNTIPLAYLSLGEDGESQSASSQDKQVWWKPNQDGSVQQNPEFGSFIVDPAHPEWQKRVLENAKKSLELGFRGLFLDTLDSGDEADQLALAQLIIKLRARYPQIGLVLNRGFRVLARVAPIVDGALFEGLNTTWKLQADGTVKYAQLENPMRAINHHIAKMIFAWAEQLGFACWALDYADQPKLAAFAQAEAQKLGFVSFTSNWQLLKIDAKARASKKQRFWKKFGIHIPDRS